MVLITTGRDKLSGLLDDRTSKGQAAGVYGAGFTAGSLARKGARCETRNKVSSDKELT